MPPKTTQDNKQVAKPAQPKKSGAKKDTKKPASQALKAQKAVKKGTNTGRVRKVRTSVHFRRPKTLELARNPKYPRNSVPKKTALDQYSVIKYPVTTETAMKKMEDSNTLVFLVDARSNKKQIKDAVKKMYDIEAHHVNTLIRPDGQKKSYVRESPDQDAMDIASKIGIL